MRCAARGARSVGWCGSSVPLPADRHTLLPPGSTPQPRDPDPEALTNARPDSSWPTIPQLYVKGEFIGGCDIVLAMHQNGELEKLFVDAGVVEPISALPDAPPS